jgi:hypothetical protein
LDVICGTKSSYRPAEYSRAGLTIAVVDAAKKRLQELGYLTAKGGATVEGKNARTPWNFGKVS